MNAKELMEKSDAELQTELESIRKEQFNLRMQRGAGQEVRPHIWRDAKKNVARIKTVQRARQQSGEQS